MPSCGRRTHVAIYTKLSFFGLRRSRCFYFHAHACAKSSQLLAYRSIKNGTLAGPEPANNTKSSAQRTASTCCHVVASETWHRAQVEDALSHQESGTPTGTMTKLPIMLLQVDKSSEYTCKKACWRIALALYTTFAPAVAISFDQILPLEVFSRFCN